MSEIPLKLTKWFDPTDAVTVPEGQKIIEFLSGRGYEPLFTQSELFRSFLSFNELRPGDLLISQKKDRILFCHHPKHYLRANWSHHLMQTHRSRSLEHLLVKTLSFQGSLQATLSRLASQDSSPHCLEVGIGSGRALLEVRDRVPHAILSGISKEYGDEGFQGLDSVEECSRLFELQTAFKSGQDIELYYQDLTEGSLALSDKTFDLIICQRTSRYIRRKDRLIESIYSHLKVGGEAFLEIQLLTLIDSAGRKIDLQSFFHQDRFAGILEFDPEFHILKIHKKSSAQFSLDLGLELSNGNWVPWVEGQRDPVGWHCTMV